jgi:uncharacterized Ntn-hydrolase superfamily protein
VQERKASAYLDGRSSSQVYSLQLRQTKELRKALVNDYRSQNKAEAIKELERVFSSSDAKERNKLAENAWKLIGEYVKSASFSSPINGLKGFTDLYESASISALEKIISEAEQDRFSRNLRTSVL